MVLENTLESPSDCKEIQPVHPKGNQSWIFIGRTDAEAETPILWPLDAKNWLIGKDPDAGKDWRLEEKGTTEDEIVGWHHRLNGHEFEQASGLGDGQGSLACCSPWDHRVGHDWATELNWSLCAGLLTKWPPCRKVSAWVLHNIPEQGLATTARGTWPAWFLFQEGPEPRMIFTFVNGWKRIKSRIWFVTQNLCKIQISVSIKNVNAVMGFKNATSKQGTLVY